MACSTERFFRYYFRLLGLTFNAQRKHVEVLLLAYGCYILYEDVKQIKDYIDDKIAGSVLNGHVPPFMLLVEAISIAYTWIHVSFVLHAMLQRYKEQQIHANLAALDEQLQSPTYGPRRSASLINERLHVVLECVWYGIEFAFMLWILQHTGGDGGDGGDSGIGTSILWQQFRYIFTMQAIRARYLQFALLVARIDDSLCALESAIAARLLDTCNDDDDDDDNTEARPKLIAFGRLKCNYMRIIVITRNLAQLYGLTILLMNLLCIFDFTIVCYVFILALEWSHYHINWLVSLQTMMLLAPMLIKMVALCKACESCSKRTAKIRNRLYTANVKCSTSLALCMTLDDFALLIQQNPIEFEVCSMYALNTRTLAAIMTAIAEFLVIFLQFVNLTKHDQT